MWKHLSEFDLMLRHWLTCAIKDEKAGACRALINGADEELLQLSFIRLRHAMVQILLRSRVWQLYSHTDGSF